jgi:hypothetical protein
VRIRTAAPRVRVIVRTVINGLTFDGATKDPMQMAVRDALIAGAGRGDEGSAARRHRARQGQRRELPRAEAKL